MLAIDRATLTCTYISMYCAVHIQLHIHMLQPIDQSEMLVVPIDQMLSITQTH
jgi:hypothetical protein